MAKGDARLKTWCALVYPESIKDDWIKMLSDNMIPCSISPVHDKDIFDEDIYASDGETLVHKKGEQKKPHHHIVFSFSGTKSFSQVWDILKMISKDPAHCPPPQIPKGDTKSAVRYHTHVDHPDKAQYSEYSVIYLNGVDHAKYFRQNEEQEDALFCALVDYIEDKNITELYYLILCLKQSRDDDYIYDDMFRYVRKHTILVNSYISSRRNVRKPKKEVN